MQYGIYTNQISSNKTGSRPTHSASAEMAVAWGNKICSTLITVAAKYQIMEADISNIVSMSVSTILEMISSVVAEIADLITEITQIKTFDTTKDIPNTAAARANDLYKRLFPKHIAAASHIGSLQSTVSSGIVLGCCDFVFCMGCVVWWPTLYLMISSTSFRLKHFVNFVWQWGGSTRLHWAPDATPRRSSSPTLPLP